MPSYIQVGSNPMIVQGVLSDDPYFSHFRIQCARNNTFDTGLVEKVGSAKWDDANSRWELEPVVFKHTTKNVTYYFRVRVVDIFGGQSSWSSTISEVCGDDDEPNEVLPAHTILNRMGRNFFITILDTYTEVDDLERYDWWIRTSSSFPTADDDNPDFSNIMKGVSYTASSDATYYVWCRAVDKNGNKSANYNSRVVQTFSLTGIIAAEVYDPSILDYSSDVDVYSDAQDNVKWDSGTIQFANGNSQSINANSAGTTISAKTYIYYNGTSTLQTTSDYSTASGTSKLLLGVAEPSGESGKNASIQMFGGAGGNSPVISGSNIVANSIDTNELVANSVTATIVDFEDVFAENISVTGSIYGNKSSYGSTTAGWWIGKDADTNYKVYFGDGNKYVKWDSSNLLIKSTNFELKSDGTIEASNAVLTGSITASSGSIGGWDITSTEIKTSDSKVVLDSSGEIRLETTTYGDSDGIYLGIDTNPKFSCVSIGGSNYLKWDGAKLVWKASNSELDSSGNLSASNATISGSITATSGAIGGWDINSTSIESSDNLMIINSSSKYIGIAKTAMGTYGSEDMIYLGINSSYPKMSLVNFGGTNYLKWDGSKLVWKAANSELDSSGNLSASNATISGSITASSGDIGGWDIQTGLLRSATSAERIELNATKNRVSIFDATSEKVAMGYLDGLQKNPVEGFVSSASSDTITDSTANWTTNEFQGGTIEITAGTGSGQSDTVYSNTSTEITIQGTWTTTPDSTSEYRISNYGNWTSADYGFWAKEGDHLAIDGDVRYDNGDWIVQHDASYLVQNSEGYNVIRMGTDTGEKGLFIYDGSSSENVLAKLVSDEIYIGESGNYLQYTPSGGLDIAGSITISNPGDINTSDLNNDAGWTDDTAADAAQSTADTNASKIFTDASGKLVSTPSPTSSGLYLGSTYLGFYDGSNWATYMANNGNFYLSGSGSHSLSWVSDTLTITGNINIQNPGDIDTSDLNNDAGWTDDTAANAAQSTADSNTSKIFTDSSGKIVGTPSLSTSGLYLGSSYMGYYNGSAWKTYMANNGNFYLSGSGSHSLSWVSDVLTIKLSLEL